MVAIVGIYREVERGKEVSECGMGVIGLMMSKDTRRGSIMQMIGLLVVVVVC